MLSRIAKSLRPRCRGARVLPPGWRWSSSYEEELQLGRIRSAQFYEEEGERRRYYYHVDSQGRLFLEDMVPKNIATSLKSGPFLNFFFSQLRWNDEDSTAESYAHKSPCGAELNFIASADTPIVMQDLVAAGTGSEAEPSSLDEWTRGRSFSFADSLSCPMHPSLLRLCSETGRLYSLLLGHPRLQPGTVCLVRSALAGRLAEGLALGASAAPGESAPEAAVAAVAQAAWSWHEQQLPARRRAKNSKPSGPAAVAGPDQLQRAASTGAVAAFFSYEQAGDAVMRPGQAPDTLWWPVLELDRSAAPDTTLTTLFEIRE